MSKKFTLKRKIYKTHRLMYTIDEPEVIHKTYGLRILGGHEGVFDKDLHQGIHPRAYKHYTISHLLEGRGWIWMKNEGKKFLTPGEAIVMVPNKILDFSGLDIFKEDFISFDGPIADQLAASDILKGGVIQMGQVRRLLPILDLIKSPHRDAQIKANILLQKLIVDLYFEQKNLKKTNRHDLIEKLIDEIMANPHKWWTIDEMAKVVDMPKVSFNRFFSSQTGLTPKKYVDKLKMEYAKEKLENTKQTLNEISEKLGYNNPFHFSKRFKQLTGFSPKEYRKSCKELHS